MSKKTPFILFKRFILWLADAFKIIRIHLLPQSLFYRFILIILLPLIFLQTVMFIFFYDRHWQTISKRLAADVAGEIITVADYLTNANAINNLNETNQFLSMASKNLSFKLEFEPKAFIPYQKLNYEDSSAIHLTNELASTQYPIFMDKVKNKNLTIQLQLPNGVLTTTLAQKRFYSSTVLVFLAWTIGTSILLFLIAFLFMKNQVRSIEKLARASELFGTGRDIDFKPTGATEVKKAGFAFLLMRDRIIKYLSERTTMLAGVSHDLRTPLTRMKLQLSMMEKNDTTTDLAEDVKDMEQMLNGYLAFARGEGKETPQEIKFDNLITQLVEKQKKINPNISLHIEEEVQICARINDISRAVLNVLTNASRYATNTRVKLGVRNKSACLMIDDDGPGIKKEKRADVFKAFYRVETSRNQSTGGIGLGLTITRDIILSHGGDIELQDSPSGGLRVIILLPLQGQETPLPEKSLFV